MKNLFMFYKYLIIVLSSALLLACSNFSDKKAAVSPTSAPNSHYAKPGVIKVKTKRDNTEVELEFNVGSDNIVFVMDVSDDLSVVKDGKEWVDEKNVLADELAADTELAEDSFAPIDEKEPEVLDIAELSGLDKAKDNPVNVNQVTSSIVKSQTLFYEREYLKSLAAINKALKESPDNAVANAIKGSIYYQLGDKKQANIYWKAALKLDSSLDSVRNGIKSLGLEGR